MLQEYDSRKKGLPCNYISMDPRSILNMLIDLLKDEEGI